MISILTSTRGEGIIDSWGVVAVALHPSQLLIMDDWGQVAVAPLVYIKSATGTHHSAVAPKKTCALGELSSGFVITALLSHY